MLAEQERFYEFMFDTREQRNTLDILYIFTFDMCWKVVNSLNLMLNIRWKNVFFECEVDNRYFLFII